MLPSSLSHVPEPPLTPSYSLLAPYRHTRGSLGGVHREQEGATETTHGGTTCPRSYFSSDHLEFLDGPHFSITECQPHPLAPPPSHPSALRFGSSFLIWNSFLSGPDDCIHSNHGPTEIQPSPKACPGQSPLYSSPRALG